VQAVGLILSIALHGAVLIWAALEILGTDKLPEPAAPTIEAEIITVAEFTNLKKGDPEAKKLEAKATPEEVPQVTKKEAPKPKPEPPKPPPPADPPPVDPPPQPAEEKATEAPPLSKPQPDPIAEKIDEAAPPVPLPTEDDAAARREKAEQQRKAKEEQRKKEEARRKQEAERKKKLAEKKRKEAERKRRAEKKKKQEDFTRRMAALLDKTPEEKGSKRSGTSLETDYTGPTAGEREGQGDQLTAREVDLLKGQISAQLRDCWRLPGGGGGIEVVQVRLSWRLKADGRLDGEPTVVGSSSDPTFRVAAEAAIRAVKCAAPFQLPRESYDAWRYIEEWTFDPRQML
jgi:colicin import membrane protein